MHSHATKPLISAASPHDAVAGSAKPSGIHEQKRCRKRRAVLTVAKKLQDGQVHVSLPPRLLLDGDAVSRGGEDVAAANGHQLAALVPASHVVQDGGIVNEGIQFAEEGGERNRENVRERDR